MKLLWLHSLEDFLPQLLHLSQEFLSEYLILHVLHVLKVFFFLSWSHHREAVLFAEVAAY